MVITVLLGFMTGCLVGPALECTELSWQTVRYTSLLLFATLPFLFYFPKVLTHAILLTACLLWGAIHHPAIANTTPHARVFFRHGHGFGAVLLVSPDKRIRRAYGTAALASYVKISCRESATLLKRYRCFTHSKLHVEKRDWSRDLQAHLDNRGPTISQWINATVLGDTSQLSVRSRAVFKHTGLYHLLVVSGFHVSLLAQVVTTALLALFWILYCLQIMSPRAWANAKVASSWVGLAFVWGFAWFTGLGCPAQRAAICFSLGVIGMKKRKLVWGMALQGLMFPCGWLSESNLMSWISYLVLLSLSADSLRGFIGQVVIITCAAWVVLGVFAPMGLISNIILTPWLVGLIVGGLLVIFLPAETWFTECYRILIIATEEFLADFVFIEQYRASDFTWLQWAGLLVLVVFLALRVKSCKTEQKLLS